MPKKKNAKKKTEDQRGKLPLNPDSMPLKRDAESSTWTVAPPDFARASEVSNWLRGEMRDWFYAAHHLAQCTGDEARELLIQFLDNGHMAVEEVADYLDTGALAVMEDLSERYSQMLVKGACAVLNEHVGDEPEAAAAIILSALSRGLAHGREEAA